MASAIAAADLARAVAERFPRCVAAIDLDAIAANTRALRQRVGPETRLMAVVKANAYGHGAVPVAIATLRAGAAALAVACVEEAIQLRRAGIPAPILVLGPTAPEGLAAAVEHDITLTICDQATAERLQHVAAAAGRTAAVQVKIDSGLHRFGIDAAVAGPFVAWLARQPRLRLAGVYTHFSSAEQADSAATRREWQRFAAVVAGLPPGATLPALHAANSAAILGHTDYHLDYVRAGLVLYGLAGAYPGGDALPQQPALSLWARVGRVHEIAPGEAVGYGRTYVATSRRRVALVGIGYADGYRRTLGGRGEVWCAGQRASVIGRVSMDQIVVDVTGIDGVEVGTVVALLGGVGPNAIGIGEMAAWIDGIEHEVVATLGPRLPRCYLQGGTWVATSDLLGDHVMPGAGTVDVFRWPAAAD